MVTLNLTLVVELVLFLLFLWGTQVFILRPTVKNIDDREEAVEADLEQARADAQEAEQLEAHYRDEVGRIRREADESYRLAFRQATQEHMEFLTAERIQADEAVAEARREVEARVDQVRPELLESTPQIEAMMVERTIGGSADGGQG
jgi:F-type H+-transporting ATPase subunit b